MKRNAVPTIAAILLLLPLLYVGSYLALVRPGGRMAIREDGGLHSSPFRLVHYRVLSEDTGFFWPLEQLDRKVRPGAWTDVDNEW